MASTAAAYRNSHSGASGKAGRVYTRDFVRSAIDSAAVRAGHRTTLAGMYRAAGEPSDRDILLYCAVEGYRQDAGWNSRRTVQYHLRELEQLGVLEVVIGSNQPGAPRRPATYRLRFDRLGQRLSYAAWKEKRKAAYLVPPPPRPDPAPDPAPPSSPRPVQSAAAAPTPAPPAAAPIRETHRGIRPQGAPDPDGAKFHITARTGGKLVGRIAELVKGVTKAVGLDGLEFELRPGQRGYRAPEKPSSALLIACRDLGIPFWAAREYCERCGLKFDDGDPPGP